MTKSCEVCHRVFERPKTLSAGQWARQRYCSRECSHLARRVRAERACLVCGKTFYPSSNQEQKYCSWTCAKERPRAKGAERVGVWKGGRTRHGDYVRVYVPDAHPFAAMRGRHRYVLEHRLVLAEKLDRPLRPNETVHHLNGDTTDNRPENLELRVGRHGRGATEKHCPTCTCFEH